MVLFHAQPTVVASPSPTTSPPSDDAPSHALHILDTKTRRTNTLPSDEEALASRLQLMLYHTLLSTITSRSPLFDFTAFWTRLGLDTSAPFSTSFAEQARLIWSPTCSDLTCLDDLTAEWGQAMQMLSVTGVDPEMEIIYRAQRAHGRGKRKRGERVPLPFDDMRTGEAAFGPQLAGESPFASATFAETFQSQDEVSIDEDGLAQALQQSLLDQYKPLGDGSGTSDQVVAGAESIPEILPNSGQPVLADDTIPGKPPETAHSSDILGIKQFYMDAEFLDRHIADVLEWWHGMRPPRGVSLEQVGRCT
jgi:exonuclease V